MKVAILGRPNVGKSTLFNRLVGKKVALVEDTPGVTRDWQLHSARLADLRFDIIDTAGLIGFEDEELVEKIEEQNRKVITVADLIILLVDARDGIISSDLNLACYLHKQQKKVLVVANKCETLASLSHLAEFYKLGMGEPIGISAAHGLGLDDLYTALRNASEALGEKVTPLPPKEERLKLAIVGRPNAGKSTLINALIGEDRLLTGPKPGITRDSIAVSWSHNGRLLELIDTAGMRRRSKIDDDLEKLATQEALLAVRFAEVVVLVLDARCPLEKQDLHIASHVIDEGRALVIALNKMDLAKEEILKEIQQKLAHTLPQVQGIPCVPISALYRKGFNKLIKAIFVTEELWNTRVSTGTLNRWLEKATERHPPPLAGNSRIRLKYITQIKSRPPTFALFISKPADLPKSYLKYLTNDLRQAFHLPGVPLRLVIRKGKNPYQS